MNNITGYFNDTYQPFKVLVIHQLTAQKNQDNSRDFYVESFDLDKKNRPINARPFSARELSELTSVLKANDQLQSTYLRSRDVIPHNVLHIDPTATGRVIWFTPAGKVNLLFSETLGIPSGMAQVPALIWKANLTGLYVYAIKENKRPTLNTPLFHAPFFNIYENGSVCMGTVKINMVRCKCLEEFTQQWEQYFWNSYFNHLLDNLNPVTGNIVQLWQSLIASGAKFPLDQLTPSTLSTLKKILL